MELLSSVKNKVSDLANGLLGTKSVEVNPVFYDLFSFQKIEYVGEDHDLSAYLDYVTLKFDLKSLIVLREGSVIGKSKWVDASVLRKISSVFESLTDSKAPKMSSDCMYVHLDDWYTFYKWNDCLLIARARDTVPVPELSVLAKNIVFFIRTGKPFEQN